ncbi:MAG: hypothetical protein PHR47_02850 [Candidatus Pacebacteria bacterium]|nr:hypothetical protein [Candidatus Paceibacterota bacterium]
MEDKRILKFEESLCIKIHELVNKDKRLIFSCLAALNEILISEFPEDNDGSYPIEFVGDMKEFSQFVQQELKKVETEPNIKYEYCKIIKQTIHYFI